MVAGTVKIVGSAIASFLSSPAPQAPAGLLAIGSRRAGKFHPGQGTELLGFLAKSLSVVIAGWLDLPT